jgi:hypothetical protein
MSRSPAAALGAAALLLLAALLCIVALQIGGYDQNLWFPAGWAALAIVSLVPVAFSLVRQDFGGALAWGYIALPLVVVLVVMTWSLIHVGRILDPTACRDYGDCGPATPATAWFCLSFSVGAAVSLLIAIRRTRGLRAQASPK